MFGIVDIAAAIVQYQNALILSHEREFRSHALSNMDVGDNPERAHVDLLLTVLFSGEFSPRQTCYETPS